MRNIQERDLPARPSLAPPISENRSARRRSPEPPFRSEGLPETAPKSGRPWDVARWGDLLASSTILLFTGLGLLHHPGWLAGALGVGLNIVTTAITDIGPVNRMLRGLGAREREDLFLPGGALRMAPPAEHKQPGNREEPPC